MNNHREQLSEQSFYILLSLAPGKKHGYAILKDVEALSDGALVLSTSTLYGALGRMLKAGLIERVPDDSEEDSPGMPRKVYIISGRGRAVLESEAQRMRALVRLAGERLAGVAE